MQSAQLANVATDLVSRAEEVNGVLYVAHQVPDGTPADGIRQLALDIRGQISAERPGVVVAAGVPSDRPAIVVVLNDAARSRGLRAGELIRTATAALGGRGGGRDDIAQGGGAALGDQAAQALTEAFGAVRGVIGGISGIAPGGSVT
jgi:alanyl-tRNA synthetase